MIRLKLESYASIKLLQFDIANRRLEIYHQGDITEVEHALHELKLGAKRQSTADVAQLPKTAENALEANILLIVLLINFGFFVLEIIAGLVAQSMGLLGDALDMLADAMVYGLSLLVVGRAYIYKQQVARLSGWLQMFLALVGFAEVVRRFMGYSQMPIFELMILISGLALIGNIISLMLINRVRSTEAHMQASAIFTSNDIIVNLGVIIAGIFVYTTSSPYPDLLIGGIVFIVVAWGAMRILKIAGS